MDHNSKDKVESVGENWTLAGPLPDKIYFIKLFKRHFYFVVIGLAITVIGALGIALNTKMFMSRG